MFATILALLLGINTTTAFGNTGKPAYLTIDAGNTRIKSALFVDGKIVKRVFASSASSLNQIELKNFVKQSLDPLFNLKGIAVSSVIKKINHSLKIACKNLNLSPPIFLNLENLHQLGFRVNTNPPFGADRLAGSLGAYYHFPKQNIIIVDSGTTTVISVIDASKTIHRGPIMPGFDMCAKALHERTSLLPQVNNFDLPLSSSPKNTEESIKLGIKGAIVGGCKLAIEEIKKSLKLENVITITSGGNGDLVYNSSVSDYNDPDLKFLGLYYFIRELDKKTNNKNDIYIQK